MEDNKRLKRKVRRSYFISTVSIALVLFLLGSVGYLILNALSVTDRMRESVTVYIMLKDNVSVERQNDIEKILKSDEAIGKVDFVSKEQAAIDFKAQMGEDFESFLDFNPLPDSFEVRFTAKGTQTESLKEFEAKMLKVDGVDEVVYQRGIVEQVGENINTFNMILIIFGIALLIISVILLNNTIRVSVYSKRHIISTMKLIGATRGFIMRPFISSSILQGIYAAIIAAAMFVGLVYGLNRGLPEIGLTMVQMELICILGGMFVLGILISLIFTIFAVNKFIKLPTNAIHLY